MALRRKISYQWRLFIPLVMSLWIIIFGMTYWQFYNEREFRMAQIREQLSFINARIIEAYQKDTDPIRFVDFVCRYYRDNPLYDLLRVSVYKDGDLSRAWGEPIGLSQSESDREAGITQTPEIGRYPGDARPDDDTFYYSVAHSADGRVSVYTVLPFDNDILIATLPTMRFMVVVFVIAVVVTFLAFISTRYLGKNIRILRNIAERAATDSNFMPEEDYPNDELGDISRQIVHMYNERSVAIQQQKREHSVAMHAIEEKARAKRELTNNINHELRTPIGVIKGYLDTILDNPDMPEDSRTRFMTKAQEHVHRLANLITDVSAITRLEEGGELIATEELDYHDVVYTIASDLEESKAMGAMTFSFDVPLDCKVKGNFNLLSGMILNLVKNAVAYSHGTMCELIMTGEDDMFYHFEFRDNGRGVGDQHLPHLFERFYRVDSGRARKAGGTGLGLPIVYKTIVAFGGTITVENGVLGGLSFKYTIPKYHKPGR